MGQEEIIQSGTFYLNRMDINGHRDSHRIGNLYMPFGKLRNVTQVCSHDVKRRSFHPMLHNQHILRVVGRHVEK